MRPKKKTSIQKTMLYTRLDRCGRDRYALGGFVNMEINKDAPRQEFFWEYEKAIKERMAEWLAKPESHNYLSNLRKEQLKLERRNKLISEKIYKQQLEKEEPVADAFTEATHQRE